MDDLTLAYREGDSAFHRMSPFAKTLYILAVSFMAIFNSSLLVGLVLVVVTFVCAAFFSGTPLRDYWRFGRVLLPFILILMVVFPFFYGGQVSAGSEEIAIRTPIKDLSWAALGFGALLALRFVAIGLSGLTFAFTTHPTDIVQNFSRRGFDYRLVHAPVLGLVLFGSFIQLAREISTTQRIRDLGHELGWLRRKWTRMKHLAFAMLVIGLRRAETQSMALDIRGYGANKQRTFLRPLPNSTAGKIFGWICLVVGTAYMIVQIGNLAGHMPWDL